jgi:hypothetical protein
MKFNSNQQPRDKQPSYCVRENEIDELALRRVENPFPKEDWMSKRA